MNAPPPKEEDVNKNKDSNTIGSAPKANDFKDAIETATDLLNKLKSAAASASADDTSDFKTAVDTATELLNKLNAAAPAAPAVAPAAPAVAPAAPAAAPDVSGAAPDAVPDASGAAGACGKRASVWSSADPSCYVVPEMPPLAQMIQAAFANEISTAGREIVMNFLKAAGIQGVESAILTPQTINQLDALSKDPEMKTKIEALQANLDNAAGQAVTGIENKVEPKLEKVVGDVEGNAIKGAADAVKGTGLGELVAVAEEGEAIAGVANQIPAIGNEISAELAPVKALTGEVDAVTNSIPSVPSLPAAPSLTVPPAPSLTVPPAPSLTVDGGAAPAPAGSAAAPAPAGSTAPSAPKKGTLNSTENPKKRSGGSSRKRRRIHKLSRRIERTLRRVHGRLHDDKNSFLRRTLRRGTHEYIKP
jgi:hypothetical protein